MSQSSQTRPKACWRRIESLPRCEATPSRSLYAALRSNSPALCGRFAAANSIKRCLNAWSLFPFLPCPASLSKTWTNPQTDVLCAIASSALAPRKRDSLAPARRRRGRRSRRRVRRGKGGERRRGRRHGGRRPCAARRRRVRVEVLLEHGVEEDAAEAAGRLLVLGLGGGRGGLGGEVLGTGGCHFGTCLLFVLRGCELVGFVARSF